MSGRPRDAKVLGSAGRPGVPALRLLRRQLAQAQLTGLTIFGITIIITSIMVGNPSQGLSLATTGCILGYAALRKLPN